MLLLATLLFWATPLRARSDSWAEQLKDVPTNLKPSAYVIPEFDPHGAFIRGPDSLQAVALTFDDGPDVDTPAILEVLARHGAKATFFMTGEQVQRYPEIARAVAQAGHEIGNHSMTHRNFCEAEGMRRSQRRKLVAREFDGAADAIAEATGVRPVLARMPYACRSGWLEQEVEALGYTVVRWSVDGRDWSRPGARTLERYYLRHAAPGAVLLMHDGGGNGEREQTVQALDAILTGLEARGLRPLTVSRMLEFARPDSAAPAR